MPGVAGDDDGLRTLLAARASQQVELAKEAMMGVMVGM